MSEVNGNREIIHTVEKKLFLMGQLAQSKGDYFTLLGRDKEARGEYLAAIDAYDQVLPDSPNFTEAHKCKETILKNR